MFRNYILIALRQLWKHKLYSGLNAIGLVAGVICFLLITLYIAHDLRFDRYHQKKDRIYRLGLGSLEEGFPRTSVSGGVMPHALQANYAGIEKVVRFRKLPSLVAVGETAHFEEKFFFTDSTVFDVFSFHLVEGDARTALTDPYTLTLTETAALRYFGRSAGVVGELLQVDESMTFKVTGVIEDIPDFSHFKFDFLASAATLPLHPQEAVRTYQLTGWYAHYFYNYLLLEEHADPKVVGRNIVDAHKYHSDPEQYKLYGTSMGLFLQPLTDIHLNPLYGEIEPQGDRTILYILAAVATLILVLACTNFANINTALSLNRRKEVGLRKTLGARSAQVMGQFLGEALLTGLFTFVISFALLPLVLPSFNLFTGKQIEWLLLLDGSIWITLAGALLLTTLLGGFYPSYMAQKFSAAGVLKGVVTGNRKFGFRKSVIVFQFTISMVLLAGALTISKQVRHLLSKDLGLSTDQVMVIPTHGDPQVLNKLTLFFDRLKQVPAVSSSAVCELVPGETVYGIIARFEGKENINFRTIGIGYNYLQTFQIELLAGRDFSPEHPLDTMVDRVIINERLARYLGWTPEEAIGKLYDRGGDGETPGEVIGVVKDFNFTSAKDNASPMVLAYAPNFFDKAVVRIGNGQALPEAVAQVKQVWSTVYPNRPFDFRFADESVQLQYQAEKKFGKIFAYFSTLAILIGILGLFGMVSVELNLRTKEVGIRKVLGASMQSLIGLLSGDFLKLVLIAFALSLPLSWWLAQQWLSQFAYHLDNIIALIVFPGLGVVVLALLVVALQTFKGAKTNPVDSLRSE